MAPGKNELLRAFGKGVSGAEVVYHEGDDYQDCYVAVMLGTVSYRGPDNPDPANIIRGEVEKYHSGPKIYLDGYVFKEWTRERYWRVHINSLYYSKSQWLLQQPEDRWDYIVKYNSKLKVQPWRTTGEHILLCMQREGGWMMKGRDPMEWAQTTINKIREYTDRPILIRPHPANPKIYQFSGINITSRMRPIDSDLDKAWCVVTNNSSVAVEPVIRGIPLFLTDADCLAAPVANFDFSRIEDPELMDRYLCGWLNELAHTIWTKNEMAGGLTWKTIEQYL
jgi:hypothetical protein